MKTPFYLIIILTIVSCGIGPKNKKGFYAYREPITKNSNTKLETDGIYVEVSSDKNVDGRRGFYIYENGLYHGELFENNFWLSPKKEIAKRIKFYEKYDGFGVYKISGDSLTIQSFWENNNEFYSKQVIIYKGIIKCDKILVSSTYAYPKKEEQINSTKIYQFCSTQKKPDSSQAWFLTKRWYKKGKHTSRK